MAINVVPQSAPTPAASPTEAAPQSAKARAMAAFMKGATVQESPVQNPTAVAPEEMTAITGQPGIEEEPKDEDEQEVKAEAPAKVPEEQQLSAQYAQLARKEKAIRAQAMQVKQQSEAMAAREAAIAAKEAELQGNSDYIPKSRLTADTMRVLQEAGIDYEQITQMALDAPSHEARQQAQVIAKLEAKLAELEGKQNSTQKSYEEQQQNQYKQAVAQIRSEAKHAVYTNPEFETIKETNSVDDVVELITKTFETDGVLLTVEEAAQAVEEHLYEEAFKLTKLSKIQKRLAEKAGATAPSTTSGKPAESTGKQPAPMKTLTNNIASSRPLSAKERAILAFKGELK